MVTSDWQEPDDRRRRDLRRFARWLAALAAANEAALPAAVSLADRIAAGGCSPADALVATEGLGDLLDDCLPWPEDE